MPKALNQDAVVLGKMRGKAMLRSVKRKPRKVNKIIAAVHLGALGGAIGGPARAKALPRERRIEIAKQGAKARHKKG